MLRRIRREATINGSRAAGRRRTAAERRRVSCNQFEPAALREIERELGIPVVVTTLDGTDPGEYSIVPVVAKEAAK